DIAPDEAFICAEYGIRRCLACSTLVTINPNGDVTPCPFYPKYVIGNLFRDERLDEVWGNRKHREFVRLQRRAQIMICSNCVMPTFYPAFPANLRYYFNRAGEKVLNLI
ncbi:MAG TPA: SPASM domain-containing protein, partial [Nitrospirae bacterium]|nr:SPASM domain-containing protein [Nitrospirota bacterium]